ncbi:MAG: TonB-dependent receptor [Cyclobacteriaceae bacterium]|nr:TonB-dependent receptor [Cyclobacteriaceae bacterium SS2]
MQSTVLQTFIKLSKLTFYVFTIICLSLSSLLASNGNAQVKSVKEVQLSVDLSNADLAQAFELIEQKTDYNFILSKEKIDLNKNLGLETYAGSVEGLLLIISEKANISFRQINESIDVKSISRLKEAPVVVELIEQVSVSGTITDENGEALPGATIQEKGTTNGTITDVEGKFSLNVPEDATLTVSFVGFTTQDVSINGRSTLDVQLTADVSSLEEVVVIGYGTVKKSDLTGSVASVTSEEINAVPASNVLQSLTGRVAGVNISQNTGAPGAEMSIRIRGVNSIQGGNEPLYVIDGFPTNQSMLLSLNSADIESIEILKDASATAIYGSRGANGVVIVTTKKGTNRKTQIDFETSYGVQTLRKKMDLMNANEYAQFANETMVNSGFTPYFTQQQIDGFGSGFDWQDELFRPAPMKKMSLNINGGTEDTQFSLGGSLFLQDGIIKRSYHDRYSAVINITHKLSDKLKVDVSSILSYINTDRKDPLGGNRGGGIIGGTLSAPPTLKPINDDGTYVDLKNAYPFMSNSISNPINSLNESTSNRKENRTLVNSSFIYNPIPELTIKVLGGIANHDRQSTVYTSNSILNGLSSASMGSSRYRSLLNENTVSYDKTFNQSKLSVLAGFTYQDFVNTSISGSGQGFISDVTETFDLGAADTPGIPSSSYSKSTLLSALARINYIYNDKYLATLTFRGDGASQYSEGDKWGYFPSGAVAWRLSNEDFFDLPSISNLKVRASWGISGNQAISAYTTLTTLNSGIKSFGEGLQVSYAPGTRLPNKLRWETTDTKDVGIDIGFFENRLNITADYYVKQTKDLLNTVGLPLSMGYTTTIRNVGSMENKGFELGIETFPFTGEFEWRLNFNISLNRNKVIELYNDQDILGGDIDVNLVQDYLNILRKGHSVGSFWGYLEEGYDDNGQIIFSDLNGDDQITLDDKTFIGNPNPNFIYGLQSVMNYKNFDLTLFFQGSQGNDIFNVSSINNTLDFGIGLNMPREVFLNHWTAENPNAKYPIPALSTNVRASERFVEDGSYLRLKNIELAYNLNVKSKAINSIRIYTSGINLITITKYSWWDPEVNSRSSAIDQGIDHFTYPTAKAFTIGLQARF